MALFFGVKMPKYYIKSGQIKYIIDRKDYKEAIIDTLKAYHGKGYMTGPKICVSETGFENHHLWKCYDTGDYIKELKDNNDN